MIDNTTQKQTEIRKLYGRKHAEITLFMTD